MMEQNQRLARVTTVLPAMGAAGEYSECAFISTGSGRFRASASSNPAYGERGELNEVEEARIETWVERRHAREVVAALRAAHPCEEPVLYLVPLLDVEELE